MWFRSTWLPLLLSPPCSTELSSSPPVCAAAAAPSLARVGLDGSSLLSRETGGGGLVGLLSEGVGGTLGLGGTTGDGRVTTLARAGAGGERVDGARGEWSAARDCVVAGAGAGERDRARAPRWLPMLATR